MLATVVPKTWKEGVAAEEWQLHIASRDAARAADLLRGLSYILTDAGSDIDRGAKLLSEMTGQQIVDALREYHRKSITAIANGLRR